MTYTTTRTITLPSSALWTQVESYILSYGGTVEAVSVLPSEVVRSFADVRCAGCDVPMEPVPDAGWVCETEGCAR